MRALCVIFFLVAYVCFVKGFSLTQYSSSGCMGIPTATLSGTSSTIGSCVSASTGSVNVVCSADGSYSVSYFQSKLGCSGTVTTTAIGAEDGVCTNVFTKMMGSVSVTCADIITANPTSSFGPPTTAGPPTTTEFPPTTSPAPTVTVTAFSVASYTGNTCVSTTLLGTATGTTTQCLVSSKVFSPLIVNCSNGNFTLQFYNSTSSCSSNTRGAVVSGVCNQCTTIGGGMESVMVDCNVVVPPPQSGSATSFMSTSHSVSHMLVLLLLLLIAVAAMQRVGGDIAINAH